MSNPGDRWRRTWTVSAIVLVVAVAIGLARLSTWEKAPGAQPFSSAGVPSSDAVFAIERPDPAREFLILRGKVTAKTARGLREGVTLLKASVGTDGPQWEIDDQLEVTGSGIAIADPQGTISASLLPGAPTAVRVNSQYGAELTGTAPDPQSSTVFADALGAALGTGSIKNSLAVGPTSS